MEENIDLWSNIAKQTSEPVSELIWAWSSFLFKEIKKFIFYFREFMIRKCLTWLTYIYGISGLEANCKKLQTQAMFQDD